jgi:hypothetical protein
MWEGLRKTQRAVWGKSLVAINGMRLIRFGFMESSSSRTYRATLLVSFGLG